MAQGLNIISVIVSIEDYRDRFSMLYGLDERVQQHIIFTKKSSSLFPGNEKVKVLCPPTPLNGIRFWNWCVEQSCKIIEQSNERWLCVQYVAGTVCRDIKKIFGAKVSCGVFLASAENHYLKKKYWSIDHEGIGADALQFFSYLKQSWKKKLIQRLSIKGCDFIIGNSSLVVDDIVAKKGVVKKIMEGNVIVGKTADIATQKGRVQLLYVGNIQPPKGLGTLFKAYQQVENIGSYLTVVGRVFDRDKKWFKALQDKYPLKNITFIDFVAPEKLSEYYLQSNIFVFPSFLEGSPRVLVEALKYGNLIIAKDIPGNRAIDKNGDFIQYYNSAEELKNLLINNIEHYEKVVNQRSAARLLIMEPLLEDNYRKKIIRFFEEMLYGKSIN